MRFDRLPRDAAAAARALASALRGDGGDAVGWRGLRVHRALAAAGLGAAASIAAAFAARALLPGPDPDVVWFGYAFRDRRWLLIGYWLGVAAVTIAPLLAVRTRDGWSASAAGVPTAARRRAIRALAALLVYGLWLGPPWDVARLARPMEWHELAHLGPLQAVLAGKDVYLEAGTQYGPGMQMLSVWYLEHFGVSLASFREFWLWTNFAGGALLVAWLGWLFPAPAVLAGLWVLRTFSPFAFFGPVPEGGADFFYGWANCLRYAGAIHAPLAFGAVIARAPEVSLQPSERVFLLAAGAVFGLCAMMAQENLGCGAAGTALLLAFAALTRAAPLRRLAAAIASFAAGTALGAAPILAAFAAGGGLGAFAHRYFAVGSDVLSGFSGAAFGGSLLSPIGTLYAAAPVAAAAVFAVAAFGRGLPRDWRAAAAACAAAGIAGHAPALLRADEAHVTAMLAPLSLVMSAAAAGLWRAGPRTASAAALALVLAVVLTAVRPQQIARLGSDAAGRLAALGASEARATGAVVGGRIGYRYDASRPYAVFSSLSLDEFVRVAQQLHERIGARPVVVASAIGTPGHWYFFADLVPLTDDPEPSMTVYNSRLRARHLAALAARPIPCVVSTRPRDAEVALFRAQRGERDEWVLETSAGPFFVGCLRGGRAG